MHLNGKWMRLIRLDVRHTFFRMKWLWAIPIYLVVIWFEWDRTFIVPHTGTMYHAGDILVRSLTNFYAIVFCFSPLFLHLVHDGIQNPGWLGSIFLRSGEIRIWWLAKAVSVVTTAALVTLSGTVSSTLFACVALPCTNTWGTATRYPPEGDIFGFNPAILHLSPLEAALFANLLLLLGWFGIGLVSVLVSVVYQSRVAGFTVAFIILMSGLAAFHAPSSPWQQLFINVHMDLNTHRFGQAASKWPSMMESILYWALWIGIVLFLGLHKLRRTDWFMGGSRS
ncbi:hypothetical protein [Salinithrix halophila]|uniref:ABC-2 type transport system permease protein n=1 Tax=Salinithrix halophila TaxID=1485204 RepID=A0ABV8JG97_9BACL